MAKSKDIHNPEAVTAYIQNLEPALAVITEAVRQLILRTDAQIGERIKWKAPSFFYTGTMPAFDPKEYKRDIVVMNLHRQSLLLVFPTGARIIDPSGSLEGNYTDGRRLMPIRDMETLNAKGKYLQEAIRYWLQTLEH